MKSKILLITLLSLNSFFGSCQQKDNKPQIDYIIINDYLSTRNSQIPPIPANYNKELIDDLSNKRIEYYKGENIIKEKNYNGIGALYYTAFNDYDKQNQVIKSVKIDEFKNDTCNVIYTYKDSSALIIEKKIIEKCKTTNTILINYVYSEKGKKIEQTTFYNGRLLSKDVITKPNQLEKTVSTYTDKKAINRHQYKYNTKKELIYEAESTTYANGVFEYLYKYDKNGNWIERIKKIFREKPSTTIKRDKYGKEIEPIIYNSFADTVEKIERTIFYK